MIKLIIGLGNPGDKYQFTRHNLGFDLVDKYIQSKLSTSESENFWSFQKKFNAETGQFKLPNNNQTIIFAKPQTHMNASGLSVVLIANYYKIAPEEICVIQDELDIPLGKIKIRLGGAAAGHHGVESVINDLKSDKFIRLRLGIGSTKSESAEHNRNSFPVDQFVLDPFAPGEHSPVKRMLKTGLKALDILLTEGLEKAQNQFN